MNMDHSRSKSEGRSKSHKRSNYKEHGKDESKSRKRSYSASLSSSDGSASGSYSSHSKNHSYDSKKNSEVGRFAEMERLRRRHEHEQKLTHDAAVNEIEVLVNKTVEEESELFLEEDENRERRPLICGKCSRSFLPGQQLLFGAHKARHSRASHWKTCPHCKVPQPNRKALIAHLKRRHPEKAKPSQREHEVIGKAQAGRRVPTTQRISSRKKPVMIPEEFMNRKTRSQPAPNTSFFSLQ